jgi:hypothetical protein
MSKFSDRLCFLGRTYTLAVANNMLMDALCAATSARNFGTSSFCENCHRSFKAASFIMLPEPASPRLVPYFLILRENASTVNRHFSTVCRAVSHKAFNSTVALCVLESNSTSRRALSRTHSSRMTSLYSADDPLLLFSVSTKSLTMRQIEMISPTEPKVIGILSHEGRRGSGEC